MRRKGKVLLAAAGGVVSSAVLGCSEDLTEALVEDAAVTYDGGVIIPDSGDSGRIPVDVGIIIFDAGMEDNGTIPAVDAGIFISDAVGVSDIGPSESD